MNTKAKSVQVFEVRLWSHQHYKRPIKNRFLENVYNGFITDSKTKKKIFFASAGDFLKAIEKLFREDELKLKGEKNDTNTQKSR